MKRASQSLRSVIENVTYPPFVIERPKNVLERQNRMNLDHDLNEGAKEKALLRRKVEKSVEVNSAAVTGKGPLVKHKDFDGTTPVEAFL